MKAKNEILYIVSGFFGAMAVIYFLRKIKVDQPPVSLSSSAVFGVRG